MDNILLKDWFYNLDDINNERITNNFEVSIYYDNLYILTYVLLENFNTIPTYISLL